MYHCEVFRVRFSIRTRRRGESLEELSQGLDCMTHKAYPEARPELLTVLLHDQCIDALDSPYLDIGEVRQACNPAKTSG